MKDLVSRALWTFVQTFVSVWALTNFELTKTALIGAVAAGISALKTLFVKTV